MGKLPLFPFFIYIFGLCMNVTMNECTSVADPDPGLGAFLTPGSGMGESQHPDPG